MALPSDTPLIRLAALGVATLLGRLSGLPMPEAMSLPVNEFLDAFFHQINKTSNNPVNTLIRKIASDLSEVHVNRTPGTFESSLLHCETLLHRHGLSTSQFVALNLEPSKATSAILSQAAFTIDEVHEIKPICDLLLTSFYTAARLNSPLYPDLIPEVLSALLVRTAQIHGTINVAIDNRKPTHDVEVAPVLPDNQLFEYPSDIRASEQNTLQATINALNVIAERNDLAPEIATAIASLNSGQHDLAISIFAKVVDSEMLAVTSHSDISSDALRRLADAARHLGSLTYDQDPARSIVAYRQVLVLEPDNIDVMIKVAYLEWKLMDYDGAEGHFRAVRDHLDVHLNPSEFTDASLGLASLSERKGDYSASYQYYGECVPAIERSLDIWNPSSRGMILMDHVLPGSMSFLKPMVDRYNGSKLVEAWYGMARTLDHLRLTSRALDAYEKLFALCEKYSTTTKFSDEFMQRSYLWEMYHHIADARRRGADFTGAAAALIIADNTILGNYDTAKKNKSVYDLQWKFRSLSTRLAIINIYIESKEYSTARASCYSASEQMKDISVTTILHSGKIGQAIHFPENYNLIYQSADRLILDYEECLNEGNHLEALKAYREFFSASRQT